MENALEKLDRKTIEKNRRIYMKGLITELTSLVPPHHFNPPMNMLSQHDQIEQVASYIKQLSKKVEELKNKASNHQASVTSTSSLNDHPSTSALIPVVKVNESGSSLEVVITANRSTETKNNFFLPQIVKIIQQGGAEVVNASLSNSAHNTFHIFHAQVKVARIGMDSSMICDRLQALIGHEFN